MNICAPALVRFLVVVLLACTVRAQQTPKAAPSQTVSRPDPDASSGLYRSTEFGFTYKVPFGWVNRTEQMSEDSNDSSSGANVQKKSTLLLAVFERPPEATGNSVNSAVVIAAEPVSSYPGLRDAEQYFGPLTELTKSKGFAAVNEPYEFRVGNVQLVRSDFSKPLSNLTMHQSTLAMIEKGYVLSFTFIGGSDDEVNELARGLNLSTKEPPASRK
jgi:hypothetical protein